MKIDESQDSVSEWIADMKRGDSNAVASLWDRYFERICQLADRKLGSATRSVVDEHDLAISAMRAVWEGAQSGRFRKLENRQDLWQLLAVITSRKAANVHRHQKVRNGAQVRASDFYSTVIMEFVELIESPPSEALVEGIPLSCRDLLSLLDQRHQKVALMRLAGHSNGEIAAQLQCSVATIERYLKNVRKVWIEYAPGVAS